MPFANFILDLIYPARCVSCGTNGEWWCVTCRDAVERLTLDPCARCLSIEPDHVCTGTLPFAGVIATGFYHSPPLRRLIAAIKYDGITAASASVEGYLRSGRVGAHCSAPLREGVLIQPMPLADTRERERGFNQAAWLADRMRNAWNIQGNIRDLLIRRKGMVQAELEHDAALRSANVRGQFRATSRINQPVLLVDDVVTTGSTAAEAARALLDAGAPQVYLAALAVGK